MSQLAARVAAARHPSTTLPPAAPFAWPTGALVLDTNVVLDLLVFDDPATRALKEALACRAAQWLATSAMRDELERVLGYPRIMARVQSLGMDNAYVLARYDQNSQTRQAAPKAPICCGDRDDQIFIDLAVAHRATLLSKDQAVLRLHKRLALLGVEARKPAARG